ncbi:hypothetical protein ACN38_g12943, partial [Penicillium nordicum]
KGSVCSKQSCMHAWEFNSMPTNYAVILI